MKLKGKKFKSIKGNIYVYVMLLICRILDYRFYLNEWFKGIRCIKNDSLV